MNMWNKKILQKDGGKTHLTCESKYNFCTKHTLDSRYLIKQKL